MKTYMKIHRLLLGVFAVAALAAFAASPALASSPGVSQNVKLKAHKRAHRLAHRGAPATETAVGVSSFGAIKAASKKPPAESSGASCPGLNSLGKLGPLLNAGATSEETTPGTLKYIFESFETKEVSPGVPGLIKLCVYPNNMPKTAEAKYEDWVKRLGKSNFSFGRNGGNETNIPYDGEPHEVGIATWEGTPPTEAQQTIVLHVNDEAECARLFPGTTSVTCFALPGTPPGPECGAGDESVAFNNYPFEIMQACPARTAFGFESNPGTQEYGNGVVLAAEPGDQITSLTVPFYSFACGKSGHWNTGDCETEGAPGEDTFSIPPSLGEEGETLEEGGVLARLYAVVNGNEVGAELGQARYTGEFPYRPSVNTEHCSSNGGWWNEEMEPPACRSAYGALIPFDFSGVPGAVVPADRQVIWTVSFNTSNSGYFPLGNATACRTTNGGNPGCGYDALNVGADKTYNGGTPFAGEDMETSTVYYKRNGSAWPSPQSSPEDPGEAPLAQIATAP